ncbi:MAG TPA: LysE family translocator, partial [Burkholderiaceae bacterium]|nr:LysE family translocator [Burkholderiaceae bacterium]
MNNTWIIISIATAVAIGAMSPGPSFVMVARTAVASSRRAGLLAALGMGIGGMTFAIGALLGLHALLAAVPWLYLLVKILGGAYIAYLGLRIWRGALQPLSVSESSDAPRTASAGRAFLLGLGTQLSNPKTAIVYASIFAALLPRHIPTVLMLVLPVIVFAIEAGWYAAVALALSSAGPRTAYLRYKAWIDRTAGGVMLLLGA